LITGLSTKTPVEAGFELPPPPQLLRKTTQLTNHTYFLLIELHPVNVKLIPFKYPLAGYVNN